MITWATPYRPHAILNWSAGALQIVKPMRKITVPRWECMDASSNKECFQDKQSHGFFDVWLPKIQIVFEIFLGHVSYLFLQRLYLCTGKFILS